MNKKPLIVTILLLTLLLFACVPIKKLKYFNDIDELSDPTANPRIQKTIMPFDKLYIKVLSIDPVVSQIFGTDQGQTVGGSETGSSIIGYMVDESGNINFPFVGNINVLSLTTSQAAEKIQKAVNEYIPNTSVTVKYIDNMVTVMGQVMTQGVFTFDLDNLNIYEAIALGGGVTPYGNRKNVILIRNEGGKVMHYRLDLSDSKIATKDTYYILPNDVIIVEPLKSLSTSYPNITYTTVLSTITTALALLLFLGYRF